MYPARSPPTPGLGLGRITGTPMGTFLGAPNGPYLAWATSHVVNLILPFSSLGLHGPGRRATRGVEGLGGDAPRDA